MRFFYIMAAILVASSSHEVEKRQTKSSKDLGEKRVVCYYTNWSVYRKGLAKYTPKNINPYLCTHLVYAFGGLTDEFEVTTFDSYQDIEQGGYAQFNGLKQYNKDTKTLLALGGWNEGSTRFSELVSFKEYRDNFTLSVIKHLRRYNFDGLDLDWEYPGSRDGSTPEDKQNYATLVMELREAFEAEAAKSSKPRLLLTMAVPAGQNYIDKGYDIPTLNKYLDFFNLLSYDYHSIYEPSINHHAALLPPPGISEYEVNYQLNVDWTVRYYLKKGASMNKLVVGIPTYGRSYTLLDENFFTIGSSADGPGIKGNYTNEKGYLAFYEICESISLYGWEVRKPYPKRVGPFAFKGNQWVGYDDEKIAVRKAEYVRENGLGGIMFWTLDSDDFRGLCNGREYPLIEAAKAALYQPSLTDENEARAVGLSRADSTSGNAITNRLNVNRPQQRAQTTTTTEEPSRRRPGRRRPGSQTAVSIDPFNTPEPPTTPSSVKAFHCKREGFYPNPDDCNKYYWCLNSGTSGLGIVAHSFTCPSDLIFSKKIDGCDHPNRVKCKVSANPGRGGPTIPPTTTPIPTTTEFEYLLDDFDYYYDYDFVDKPNQPLQEVAQIENFLEQNINQPIRNAGGSQFQEVTETETKKEEPVPPEPEVVRSRTPERPGAGDRPQYSSIQRDRSRLREETVVEEQPTIAESESPSSRPQRPQYVTLNRQRPASVNVVDQQEEAFVGVVDSTPESVDGLTYVTLERNRHPSTEPSVFDESELTTAGLEYVTLNRAKPSTTKEPGSDYLYDYYTDEELSEVPAPQEATTAAVATTTTTTTTETTTTEKPRIRLPPRLRASRPRPSPRPRPSFRGRPAPQTVQPVEEGEEKLDRRTRFRGRTTPQPEETKEEEKVDRLTRFRGRLTPRPVEPREQEEADRSTRLRGRPNPQLVLPREEKESVITELPTELPQVTSTPEPDKPLTATPELLQEALAKPVELLVDSVEPTQGSVDVDAKTADQSVEPTEQPKEAVTQPEEAIEPEKSVPKFQDGDSLIEETLLLFKKNKQELENEPSPERESRIRPFLGRRREEPSSKILETTTEVKELPETATIPVESPETPVRTPPRTRIPPRTRTTTRTRIPPRPRERPLPPRRLPPRLLPGIRPTADREKPVVEEEVAPEKVSEVSEIDSGRTPEEAFEVPKSETGRSDSSPPFSFFDILPGEKPSPNELANKTTTTPEPTPPRFKLRLTPKPVHEIPTTEALEESELTSSPEFPFPLQTTRPITDEVTSITTRQVFFDFFDKGTSKTTESSTSQITTEFEIESSLRTTAPRRLTPLPVQELSPEPRPTRPRPQPRPQTTITQPTPSPSPRPSRPRPFITSSSSPLFPAEYDYIYDYETNDGVLGGTLEALAHLSNKATLHPDGTIECLDTGYFPHPDSCKKFISCSKTVRGFLRGWIYTCPQELVFDPVGGMCNWTEDVDCSIRNRA